MMMITTEMRLLHELLAESQRHRQLTSYAPVRVQERLDANISVLKELIQLRESSVADKSPTSNDG
jgi:hypothetical protein